MIRRTTISDAIDIYRKFCLETDQADLALGFRIP
jgi:hypothetical protein